MEGFGESVDPTAAIASILGTYPFSIGLLREILQNSDDAKADTQIFLIDYRTHGKEHLLHEALGDAQGPALLAYNNATFSSEDWVALRKIHQSSKRTDTSKIGKYGIGFRSCYHITDTPQIISGSSLGVLDPHHDISSNGGLKVDFTADFEKHADHVAAFNIDKLVPSYVPGTPLNGTIIRLPLRRDALTSRLSSKALTPDEIRRLLLEFVKEEMDIALLFLSHLKVIVVMEVHDRQVRRLGKTDLKKTNLSCSLPDTKYKEAVVSQTSSRSQTWRLIEVNFPSAACAELLSHRLGYDVITALEKEKLSPVISLAIRTPLKSCSDGRLFTYLPLPLPTGFPCHIHALFALTQARQNLWNCSEKGLVSGTRDELLVVWNKALFDTFIPRAWAAFIQLLSSEVSDSDAGAHFTAWPPALQHASGGDPFYWQTLGSDLLRVFAEEQQPVWPVAGTRFASLNEVLVGRGVDAKFVQALSAAGVDVTMPPDSIVEMMHGDAYGCKMLSPKTARSIMMEDATPILLLSITDRQAVLEYLLSTGNMKLLIGIFVVPLISGDHTALEDASSALGQKHLILHGPEVRLFGRFDHEAINLQDLRPSVRELFLNPRAPSLVNVVHLGCAHVAQHLATLGNESEDSESDITSWLFQFWAWLVTWPERSALIPMISHMPIVPDNEGHVHALSSTLFRLDGINDMKQKVFTKLGISFLHAAFPQSAVTYLESKEVLRSINSPTALLEHLRPRRQHGLSDQDCAVLCNHMSSCLPRLSAPLSNVQKARLRDLAIFPVMSADETVNRSSQSPSSTEIQYGSLPHGKTIHVVDVVTSKILAQPMQGSVLLPSIPETIFVARYFQDFDIIPIMSYAADIRIPTAELIIIEVFIDNISAQPKRLQKFLLENLVLHRQTIPPLLLQTLKTKAFVVVGSRKRLAAPEDVVDPKHKISRIFESNDARLPRLTDPVTESIVQSLRSLQLLRTTLTDEIIKERLKRMSKSVTYKGMATNLLHLLNDSRYDCSGLQEELALPWIPSLKGLRKPAECRDDSAFCKRELFDLVLDVLDVREFQLTSPSLRAALNWDKELPLDIIKRQLDAELRGDAAVSRLTAIIKELGRRVEEIEGSDLANELQHITSMQQWIPISHRALSSSSRALLASDRVPPGFDRVLHALMVDEGSVQFLKLMGCCERAANSALLEELHAFGTDRLTAALRKNAFRLIEFLDVDDLSGDQWTDVLVPDKDSCLRPLSELYYDDLGARAYEIELPEDLCKVHDDLRSVLVAKLGIQTLSSLNLGHVDIDDDDMQEDLSTRISNVLRQYSVDQTLNEFLANAADAGARQYDILLDKKYGKTDHILSPTMGQFQTCPSLILHNDGVFTEKDFKGIRRIGVGGKQSQSHAIGKFGLGALSMFHFTELSMIVSGAYVMFLDPSKSYLPSRGRRFMSSLRVPLARMWQLHTDHLNVLRGIYGFEVDMEYYDGTLFRLPLRNDSQADKSTLSKDAISAHTVADLVNAFGTVAPQSLLNISVVSISASRREHDGTLQSFWSTKATRRDIQVAEDDPYCQEVDISFRDVHERRHTQTWHLVTNRAELDTLPSEFQGLALKHKLRDVSVTLAGLASSGNSSQPLPPLCRLYSQLPLPTFTALPVHIDASFILADDRRSIRFDESGQVNLESRYNCWLLSDKIPSLYTFLLQSWPQQDNVHMWPGSTALPEDPISRMIIDSFYKDHFASSFRTFCVTMTRRRLSPSQAVFLDTESKSVKAIIKVLKPPLFVQLSKRLRLKALVTGVKVVDAKVIHDTIAEGTAQFGDAFSHGAFGVADVNSLLDRLMEDSPDAILGLTILPLANDALGCIRSPSETPFFTPVLQPGHLFPAGRFVHARVDYRKLVDQAAFNVRVFSGECAAELMKDILPSDSAAETTLEEAQAQWVKQFWAVRAGMGIDLDVISQFPLVPTDHGTYVSLAQCRSPRVLAFKPADDENACLNSIIKALGAVMIAAADDCTDVMLEEIRQIPALLLDFENILRYLETLSPLWTQQYLDKVDLDDQRRFSVFCLSHIRSLQVTVPLQGARRRTKISGTGGEKTVQHRDVARQLPIWWGQKLGSPLFVSASDPVLKMLPDRVALTSVSAFLGRGEAYTEYDDRLRTVLGVEPLTFQELINSFQLPITLRDPETIMAYKQLLEALMYLGLSGVISMKLPNSSGTLTHANTLCDHRVPLFQTVFDDNSDRFVHQALRGEFAQHLQRLGLQVDVNFSTFKECASAVHTGIAVSVDLGRATTVYQYYNEELWRSVDDDEQWEELSQLSFVPRDDIRRHYKNPTFSSADYAVALPSIVSPDEILRPELEAVAWTQRSVARIAPNERLLVANLELGIPTEDEVVEHLRRLVLIADDYPNDRNLLFDLTETYKWLTVHRDDCKEILLECQDEQLFLNVDDTESEWRFSPARRILFNGHDEEPWQSARTFLLPLKELLLTIGAKEIKQAVRPPLQLSSADEVLVKLRTALNQQRQQNRLTDVELLSSDDVAFPAHRAILAAASTHFEAMFGDVWRELTGPVHTEESSNVLRYALEYIYGGQVKEIDSQEILLGLLELSDRWNLPELFQCVQHQLIPTISLGTHEDLHRIACIYHATLLTKACEQFKIDNAHAI